MDDAKFLFDTQLIATLEKLIRTAKHRLLLVSPFIDLDRRIQDAMREHLSKHDFELQVLFGKNEGNYYKSIKNESLEFLKQFPNVEIRYNDRLHAKFYQNDFDFILTSLNLYDYSLAKNIEVGIICNYAMKGFVGKVIDTTDNVFARGVEKVRQDVFGMEGEIDPIKKFEAIFQGSDLKYKAKPIIIDEIGIKGLIGGKKLNGFDVVIDNLLTGIERGIIPPTEPIEMTSGSGKLFSARQLSKFLGVSSGEITSHMEKAGLIDGDKITQRGHTKGLIMKNYMGNDYISYPENLQELIALKNKRQ